VPRLVAELPIRRVRAAQVRVIYGDTDLMGVVYHGTYMRYMEHARVEFIRSLGVSYADMERMGFGLPVTDLAASYLAPAHYDDLISLWVGLMKVSWARVRFSYELTVEPGDRAGLEERLLLLRGETHHGCMALSDKRAAKLPDEIHDMLDRHWRYQRDHEVG
jgi:acyl-CoA thioester hydrolase